MALIPPFYMNTVVAIGYRLEKKIQWAASGFFYAPAQVDPASKPHQPTFLVSNCHVLSGRDEVFLRLNPQGREDAIEVPLKLNHVVMHPKVDVAVVAVDFEVLIKHKMNAACFDGGRHVARRAQMTDLGVSEGDHVYVLGFPMSLVGQGDRRNSVLVRHGTIARLRDTLEGHSPSFLVDTFVFPGNSGGPVILEPEAFAIEGTKKVEAALLVGMVAANIFYKDTAVSTQTNRPRIIFEDNAGLGVVYPVDYIEECIALAKLK